MLAVDKAREKTDGSENIDTDDKLNPGFEKPDYDMQNLKFKQEKHKGN
jgi:hypothetical protein